MKVARLMMSVIAPALVAAACGDDMEPEEALTEEEAIALFKSMSTPQLDTTIVPIHLSEDSIVIPCPLGGQAKLVGAIAEPDPTVLPDTLRFVTDVVITPRGCRQTGDGMRFTVDGDPSLRDKQTADFVFATLESSLAGSFAGGVKWELEDRSGSCEMDLTFTSEVDASDPVDPRLNLNYKGSACDHDVEFVVSRSITVN